MARRKKFDRLMRELLLELQRQKKRADPSFYEELWRHIDCPDDANSRLVNSLALAMMVYLDPKNKLIRRWEVAKEECKSLAFEKKHGMLTGRFI